MMKGKNMKYRPITELTNEEIEFIVNEIFAPKEIENIERDEENHRISVDIGTEWGDENESFDITDTVELYEPCWNSCLISVDFSISLKDELKWEQYCASKGCYPLFKNNPYLSKD